MRSFFSTCVATVAVALMGFSVACSGGASGGGGGGAYYYPTDTVGGGQGTDASSCQPTCASKVCGDNGCGGSCGTCGSTSPHCVAGLCKTECTPTCTGKACGDNGCGGSCGSCLGGKNCSGGQCVTGGGCGDGKCDSAENEVTCPADCKVGGKTDEQCQQAVACGHKGLCASAGSTCVAKSTTQCQSSTFGKAVAFLSGSAGTSAVAVDGGVCRVTPDAVNGCDTMCMFFGLCVADGGYCKASSAEDCAAGFACGDFWFLGWCSPKNGDCLAATTADCTTKHESYEEEGEELISACTHRGTCVALDGVCIAVSGSDCAKSAACANGAQCSLQGDRCVATSVQACQGTAACMNGGACGIKDGICAPTSEQHCKSSLGCYGSGNCKLGTSVMGVAACVPGSDEDCAKAAACEGGSKCSYDGAACIQKPCESSFSCGLYQTCASEACVPEGELALEFTAISAKIKGSGFDIDGSGPDVYACLYVDDVQAGCTKYVMDSYEPAWYETIKFKADPASVIVIWLMDSDVGSDGEIAGVKWSSAWSILSEGFITGKFSSGSDHEMTYSVSKQ